jgi:hypothetical protein
MYQRAKGKRIRGTQAIRPDVGGLDGWVIFPLFFIFLINRRGPVRPNKSRPQRKVEIRKDSTAARASQVELTS